MKKSTSLMLMIATAGCAALPGAGGGVPPATAELRNAEDQVVGTATLVQDGDEVEISVLVMDLPPGPHGIHLHQTGRCTPPDFSSAGGHYAPESRQHGFENPNGPHGGDLPNIDVSAERTGHFVLENDRVTLTDGSRTLFDADGTAIVVHAGPDDYRTDPAGDSGARIACGVIGR